MTVIASNKAVTNKVLANEEITDVKAGDVIYLYANKAKRLKITGEDAIKVTGAFKYIAAPDATKSVVTATNSAEDATKVTVDVKDLAVNEKGQMYIIYYRELRLHMVQMLLQIGLRQKK